MSEFDLLDLDGLEEVVRQGEWKEVSDRQEQLLALIGLVRRWEEDIRKAEYEARQNITSDGPGKTDALIAIANRLRYALKAGRE